MPRYEYDPSKTQATLEVFPAGDHLFVLGEPKAFKRTNKKNVETFGIRFPISPKEGPLAGKKSLYTAYLHNDGSQSMTKRFQMAVLGYKGNTDEEKRFDAEQIGLDWSFDPDSGSVGEAWKRFSGATVIGSVTVGKNEDDDTPQQNWKSWRPSVEHEAEVPAGV